MIAIQKFYDEGNKLPGINNDIDAKKVLKYAKSIYEKAKIQNDDWINNIEHLDENIIMNVAKWSRCEISPICSFLGGIVSQEIIKATGKYIPIEQWLWFDFFETVEKLNENTDRNIKGSRYDDQIAIFGIDIQKN